MIKKIKKWIKETSAIFLLIPILFYVYFFDSSESVVQGYDLIYILFFLLVKKIRDHIFTRDFIVSSAVLAAVITVSFYKQWQYDLILCLLIALNAFIAARGFLSLWLMIKNDYESNSADSTKKSLTVFLEVFAAVFISLVSIWLYKFYPSGISPDTVNQWAQIHGSLPFTDIHTPLHTLMLKAFIHIRDSYNIVILFNIVLVSFMAAFFAKYFYKRGVSCRWLLIVNIIFTFSYMSVYYMYPYKDIPYTFVLGALTYMLMRITDGAQTKVIHAILWGALLTVCYYLRYNGIVCAVIVSGYLIYLFIKKRYIKQLAAFALTFAIMSFGLHFIIYNVMDCEHVENGFSMQVFGSGIASVVAQDGNISDEEMGKIDEILGVEWINKHYEKQETKNLIWDTETNDPDGFFKEPKNQVYNNFFVVEMGRHKGEVIKLYFSLFIKNPKICINDIIENTYHIWGYTGSFSNIILIITLISAVMVFWKGKRPGSRWIVFVPVFANILSIAISTITKELRYLMPTVTLFPPLLFYIIVSGKHMKDKNKKAIGEVKTGIRL